MLKSTDFDLGFATENKQRLQNILACRNGFEATEL